MFARLVFIGFIAALPAQASKGAECVQPASQKTDFGLFVDDQRTLQPEVAELISANAPSRYMRVHFRANEIPNSKWTLRIYDDLGRPLEAIASKDAKGEFWSARLAASKVSILLDSSGADQKVEILEHIEMHSDAKAHYYSISGAKPNWTPLYEEAIPRNRVRRGEPVGMLFGTYGSNVIGHYNWSCSGALISNDPPLFVTAAHCGAPTSFKQLAWSPAITSRMLIDLSWDGDEQSREALVEGRPILLDVDRDLAVLRVLQFDRGALPQAVTLRDRLPLVSEDIYLIHHPASEKKQISQACRVEGVLPTGANGTRFTHRCDSESGSSGAPIFDNQGNVIGLHTQGYEKNSNGLCDNLNKAISAKTLIELLREKQLDVPHVVH